MRVIKERQMLVFQLDDSSTVKYNLQTRETIGKLGKPVKDLRSQLRGYSMSNLLDSFENKNYANFLRYVWNKHSDLSNIGSILEKAKFYSSVEQIFSAGVGRVRLFTHKFEDIPKGLIKLCREHDLVLSNDLFDCYKANPDAFALGFSTEYQSLTDNDIFFILTESRYRTVEDKHFTRLVEWGYTPKAIFNYIDYLKTYEALEDISHVMNELEDYANMMRMISQKFDKYPRNFLTTHRISARNYNRLKKHFEEKRFAERRDESLECKIGEYRFIYPKTTQDIKDEAVQQHNCVASYIDRVIDGDCHILFMRKAKQPDESVVTVEVRDNKIVQALQKFNAPLTAEQKNVVEIWNSRMEKKEVKQAC